MNIKSPKILIMILMILIILLVLVFSLEKYMDIQNSKSKVIEYKNMTYEPVQQEAFTYTSLVVYGWSNLFDEYTDNDTSALYKARKDILDYIGKNSDNKKWNLEDLDVSNDGQAKFYLISLDSKETYKVELKDLKIKVIEKMNKEISE